MTWEQIIICIVAPLVGWMANLLLSTRAALFRDYMPRREMENYMSKIDGAVEKINEKLEMLLVKVAKRGGGR
ncbi:MAG: hypothetical protein LBT92_01520 [Rickettsiales bacterium]|jgi:hypothetical protein|nr:hypothetical protein [Rickettsiales bacterium]